MVKTMEELRILKAFIMMSDVNCSDDDEDTESSSDEECDMSV